jgi:hypothetical protein
VQQSHLLKFTDTILELSCIYRSQDHIHAVLSNSRCPICRRLFQSSRGATSGPTSLHPSYPPRSFRFCSLSIISHDQIRLHFSSVQETRTLRFSYRFGANTAPAGPFQTARHSFWRVASHFNDSKHAARGLIAGNHSIRSNVPESRACSAQSSSVQERAVRAPVSVHRRELRRDAFRARSQAKAIICCSGTKQVFAFSFTAAALPQCPPRDSRHQPLPRP